jgi:hypothetical protein
MTSLSRPGQIFLGAPIEHGSERAFLVTVHRALTVQGVPFVILANLILRERQIDCIVATADRVILVEVKATRQPLRGAINGDWARAQPDGRWAPYGNAYQQALGAALALRDAMGVRSPLGSYYPEANLTFMGGLPEGTDLPIGDFKVALTFDGAITPSRPGRKPSPWSLDQWERFAADLRLEAAKLEEAIAPPRVQAAHRRVRDYGRALIADFGADGARWLPEDDAQRATALSALAAPIGCRVTGPTGCGKTLLGRWMAAAEAEAGVCVLYLAAKDFDGSWARLLEREIALLIDGPPSELWRAARLTGVPVRIIVDGLNELGGDRDHAMRGLRALVRRLGARLTVTTQSVRGEGFAELIDLPIAPPSLDLKQRIARSTADLGPGATELLRAVESGIEAAIVGELGTTLPTLASRQLLIDRFIRARLGRGARDGYLGLRRLARILFNTVAFSMGETAFDDLMVEHHVAASDSEAIFSAQLLVRRSGRVSFGHEMILNGCAAFAVARDAERDPVTIAQALNAALYEGLAPDVVAMIEDPALCETILAASCRPRLLHDAARGRLGAVALPIAIRLIADAETAVRAEIDAAELIVVPGGKPTVAWRPEIIRPWSDAERARIDALSLGVDEGEDLERYMALRARMDARLLAQQQTLFEEAKAAGVGTLGTDSFWMTYYGFGGTLGFTRLTNACLRGHPGKPEGQLPHRFVLAELSSGQLHYYLRERYRFIPSNGWDGFAEELLGLLRSRFAGEPYHVRLEILEAAGFTRNCSEDMRERLIVAIHEIDQSKLGFGMSWAITDALKFLGAFGDPDSDNREQILAEIAEALGPQEDDFVCGRALSICGSMFDHPFDATYYDEVMALTDTERHCLYAKALRAPDIRQSMSLAWLLRQFVSQADPDDAKLVRSFAELPGTTNIVAQEEWGAFVVATRFLGRLGLALPPREGTSPAARCLELLRALLHAAENNAAKADIPELWRSLDSLPAGVVIGCFSEVETALGEQHWSEMLEPWSPLSLAGHHPERCLAQARHFFDEGHDPVYFQQGAGRPGAAAFALGCLERSGDRSDLGRVRSLTLGGDLASSALRTLRKLDTAV